MPASAKATMASSLGTEKTARRSGARSKPGPSRSQLLRDIALLLSILGGVVVAYWPALTGGMVWDDERHITSPPLQSLHGLWRIWFELGATQQYYPLLHSAFWVEHRLWGEALLGYHLANVAEHALSAFLIVLILRRLEFPGAWLAGFLFALHPVCVEAVAWISEQKSTLSGLFYFAAALTYFHFDRNRRRSTYFVGLGLFVLAVLSKSVTATLPAALLVVFWWKRGRLDWRRDLLPLAPWFAIGASSGLFTAWVERTYIGAAGKTYELSFVQHILLAARIPFFYASKVLWPSNLSFSYARWNVDGSVWWQYLYALGFIAVLATCIVMARRPGESAWRGPLAAFLFFVGTLFPALGFLHVYPFRFSYVADHFQYLATLGILVPVTFLLSQAWSRRPRIASVPVSLLGGIPLLVLFGFLTHEQGGLYRDAETLYRATIARNPGSWLTHNNLAGVLAEDPDRVNEAIDEYHAAIQLKPDYALAHNSLGGILMKQPGKLDEAISEFHAAIQAQPDFALAHNNLGIALALMPGHLEDAVAEFQTALRFDPKYAKPHMNLGNAYSQMPGRLPDAIAEYEAAIRLQPDYLPAYKNLGMAYMQMPEKLADAVKEFQFVLQRQPKDAKTHDLLGVTLSEMPGRANDAVKEFEEALAVQPSDLDTRLSFADALSKMPGRRQEAIGQYEGVLHASPNSEEGRRALEALRELEGHSPR